MGRRFRVRRTVVPTLECTVLWSTDNEADAESMVNDLIQPSVPEMFYDYADSNKSLDYKSKPIHYILVKEARSNALVDVMRFENRDEGLAAVSRIRQGLDAVPALDVRFNTLHEGMAGQKAFEWAMKVLNSQVKP